MLLHEHTHPAADNLHTIAAMSSVSGKGTFVEAQAPAAPHHPPAHAASPVVHKRCFAAAAMSLLYACIDNCL